MPQRFEQKLWDLATNCKSESVHWNKSGDAIVFDFVLFKKEFLDHSNKFCKSDKLASFVRQLNLYGFKKVTSSRKSRRDIHEFKHPWFARDREEWLQNVTRNAVFPSDAKRRSTKRLKAYKKKRAVNQENNEPRKVGRRGRPRKSEQLSKKLKSDHSYEKKATSYWEKKEIVPCFVTSSKKTENLRESGGGKCFKDLTCVPFNQVNNVQHWNTESTLLPSSQLIFSAEAMQKEFKQPLNKFKYIPKQEGKHASTTCHDGSIFPIHPARQCTLPIQVLQGVENIDPTTSEHSTTAPPNEYAIQPRWDEFSKSDFQAKYYNKGNVNRQPYNINKTLVKQIPPVAPQKTSWTMEATVDENQHVRLRINNTYKADQNAKLNEGNNYKNKKKITIPDGQIGKQLLTTERMEYINSVLSTNIENLESLDNQSWNIGDASQAHKPSIVQGTECYVTEEFLDIREAYFRHYPERRSALDGPDLRIYRKL